MIGNGNDYSKEARNGCISEPDANGVRYFDMNGGQTYEGVYQRQLTKKKRPVWANVLIFIGILICIFAIAASGMFLSIDGSTGAANLPSDSYIAKIYVEGTIQESNTDYFGTAQGYQHEWTLNLIDELAADDNNMGMIIFVNSPGGTIYESDELYLKIKEYQENTERPVYAVMGSMAASGGYYISAPCDMIYANRNTWTGSIGVTIGNIFDISEFLNKNGIKVKTITSGENKAMGSSYQAMSEEEEAIWQGLVDEAYEQFAGIVATERGLDMQYVKSIADGRIYSAQQAVDIGLVDRLGDTEAAYADMLKVCELDESSCRLADLEYVGEQSLIGSLFSMAFNMKQSGDAAAILNLVEEQSMYPASYLCEDLAR